MAEIPANIGPKTTTIIPDEPTNNGSNDALNVTRNVTPKPPPPPRPPSTQQTKYKSRKSKAKIFQNKTFADLASQIMKQQINGPQPRKSKLITNNNDININAPVNDNNNDNNNEIKNGHSRDSTMIVHDKLQEGLLTNIKATHALINDTNESLNSNNNSNISNDGITPPLPSNINIHDNNSNDSIKLDVYDDDGDTDDEKIKPTHITKLSQLLVLSTKWGLNVPKKSPPTIGDFYSKKSLQKRLKRRSLPELPVILIYIYVRIYIF